MICWHFCFLFLLLLLLLLCFWCSIRVFCVGRLLSDLKLVYGPKPTDRPIDMTHKLNTLVFSTSWRGWTRQ